MKKRKIVLSDEQLIEANIPRRFWKFSREDYFGREEALEQCERYIAGAKKAYNRGLGIVLRGMPETGKTWLLSYVCRCLLAKEFKVYYTTLDDITEWIFSPSTEKFSAKFLGADFVALDSVNSVTGGTQAAFRKFVALRTDNAMPMLLSTALMPEQDLVGETDPFVNGFPDSAPKVLNVSIQIKCAVSEFRIRKHYDQLKKGF